MCDVLFIDGKEYILLEFVFSFIFVWNNCMLSEWNLKRVWVLFILDNIKKGYVGE